MTVRVDGPCLRCVWPEAEQPGEAATCETRGILAPAIQAVSAFQVAETMKLLVGAPTTRGVFTCDVWRGSYQVVDLAAAPAPGATLRHARDNGELRLHLQPKVSLKDNRLVGAEALLPWHVLAIELVWTHRRGQPFSRLNDSIADVSCGVLSQLAGIFDKALTLGVFVWVAAHASVQQWLPLIPAWPDRSALIAGEGALGFAIDAPALLSWAVTFFLVDLCYYWSHRMSHEVNLLWAGHVVHHQSEEYNLSVALRQATIGKLVLAGWP